MYRSLGIALAALALAASATPANASAGALADASAPPRQQDTLNYGGLLQAIERKEVDKASFSTREDVVDVRLEDGSKHLVAIIDGSEEKLAESLVAGGASVAVDGDVRRAGSGIGMSTILKIVGVILLFLAVGLVVLRHGRRKTADSGADGVGGSRR